MLNCPCSSLAQIEPVSPLYGELILPLAIPRLADSNALGKEELVLPLIGELVLYIWKSWSQHSAQVWES